MPDPRPPIHALPDTTFKERLRELDGTPCEVLQNAELMELALPTLRADFELCESYVHAEEQALGCRISAFGGVDDREVSPEEISGWRRHTSAVFRERMYPGGHFYLLEGRTRLLEDVRSDLRWLLE